MAPASYISVHAQLYIEIVCISLSALTFLIRSYVRVRMLHFFGWDDWTMLLGLVRPF